MSDGFRVVFCETPAAVAQAGAREIMSAARSAEERASLFTLVLSGGSTPRAVYRLLASETLGRLNWQATRLLFGDERCVGPDHADSNFRMVSEELLERLPIPRQSVRRIEGERGSGDAAASYDRIVRESLEDLPGKLFDVVLLGMGGDGHTASLFPGRDYASDGALLAVPATAPPASPIRDRVSLTLRAISRSRRVVYMVTGEDKRSMLARVLDAMKRGGDPALPASMVTSAGEVVWLVDRAAHP